MIQDSRVSNCLSDLFKAWMFHVFVCYHSENSASYPSRTENEQYLAKQEWSYGKMYCGMAQITKVHKSNLRKNFKKVGLTKILQNKQKYKKLIKHHIKQLQKTYTY